VRQDAGTLASALHRSEDVQQVGVVALPGRRCAKRLEALMRIVQGSMPVLQRLSENGGLATT
jgi:hypothetical protein